MKKRRKKTKPILLHFIIHYCWLKKKQYKAYKDLIRAIQECPCKQELNTVLTFKQFLIDRPTILQAYEQQLKRLEEQPSQFSHS